MGVTVQKSVHWTCDAKGCNEHGKGEKVPEGWRSALISEPGAPAPMGKCLLCPNCFKRIFDAVSLLIFKPKPAVAA
jgi:hypothetical protein